MAIVGREADAPGRHEAPEAMKDVTDMKVLTLSSPARLCRRPYEGRRGLLGGLCLLGLILGHVGSASAGNLYGTDSSGRSCIGNLTDCYVSPDSGPGPASRRYAAFAATSKTGTAVGWSFDWGSRAAAEREALRQCRQSAEPGETCVVAHWFYNTCGALAQDPDGSWGAGHAPSRSRAEKLALEDCAGNSSTGQCKIVKAFCQ